jgi:NTP pyrophosphatase (non-canonical NTP hydrolase)
LKFILKKEDLTKLLLLPQKSNLVFLNLITKNRYRIDYMSKENLNLDIIKEKLKQFSKERDWEQYHSPKNLAMALSVEVAELVEIFQWSNDGGIKEVENEQTRKEIEEEIADIFNYLIKFVDLMDLDLEKISLEKIQKNDEKYPVEKAKGTATKYTDL